MPNNALSTDATPSLVIFAVTIFVGTAVLFLYLSRAAPVPPQAIGSDPAAHDRRAQRSTRRLSVRRASHVPRSQLRRRRPRLLLRRPLRSSLHNLRRQSRSQRITTMCKVWSAITSSFVSSKPSLLSTAASARRSILTVRVAESSFSFPIRRRVRKRTCELSARTCSKFQIANTTCATCSTKSSRVTGCTGLASISLLRGARCGDWIARSQVRLVHNRARASVAGPDAPSRSRAPLMP